MRLFYNEKDDNRVKLVIVLRRKEATRTPDPYVPNVVRYQLRYFPKCGAKIKTLFCLMKFYGCFFAKAALFCCSSMPLAAVVLYFMPDIISTFILNVGVRWMKESWLSAGWGRLSSEEPAVSNGG